MPRATLSAIYVHPVKGLSPCLRASAELVEGLGLQGDRSFALQFLDPDAPALDGPDTHTPWMPKARFAMQHDWPSLAALECAHDPEGNVLTLRRAGSVLFEDSLLSPEGRARLASFVTGFLAASEPGKAARHAHRSPLRLVGRGERTKYSDTDPGKGNHVTLVGSGSVASLAAAVGAPVDVRRFRANLVVDGLEPWEELTWVGRTVRVGATRLAITGAVVRCLNIDVNPETGERDLPLLAGLRTHFGHVHMAVMARIETAGTIRVSDVVELEPVGP